MNKDTITRLRADLPSIRNFLKLEEQQQSNIYPILAKRVQLALDIQEATATTNDYQKIAMLCNNANTAKQIMYILEEL